MNESLVQESSVEGLLGKCVLCDLPLPLRLAGRGERGRDWSCAGCGAIYHAVVVEETWARELRNNIRFAAEGASGGLLSSAQSSPADHGAGQRLFRPQGGAKSAPAARRGVLCPIQSPLGRKLDSAINNGLALRIRPRGEPFVQRIQIPTVGVYDHDAVTRIVSSYEQASQQTEDMFSCLARKQSGCLTAAASITEEALLQAVEDVDLFVCLGINPLDRGYPARHSLHVAMLAMSIGAQMGWDESTLVDLGIGCLIHDVGMHQVDEELVAQSRVLSNTEYLEIVKHPLHTFDLVEDHLETVPPSSRMVAYQIHERCDGTGYPRGRSGDQIHPLAKIAAVADVFVALVSPRPHRPGLMPYYAIEKMLHGAKEGQFDADVVRSLLHAVSLFPLGSYVLLNDGRVGRVIRANGPQYDRPVVEAWKSATLQGESAVIDLSQRIDLQIMRPLPASQVGTSS